MQVLIILELLVLLTIANGVPVIAKRLLGDRLAWPLDGNARFIDGRPLFGASKTIRGLALAVVATGAVAPLLGLAVTTGVLVGAGAMAGDLVSSFTKRRLDFKPSSRATGLDQIPESLFPLVACSPMLGLNVLDVAAGTVIFLIGEILISRVLYRLRLRDRPY